MFSVIRNFLFSQDFHSFGPTLGTFSVFTGHAELWCCGRKMVWGKQRKKCWNWVDCKSLMSKLTKATTGFGNILLRTFILWRIILYQPLPAAFGFSSCWSCSSEESQSVLSSSAAVSRRKIQLLHFSSCSKPWVKNFLFFSNPASQIDVLQLKIRKRWFLISEKLIFLEKQASVHPNSLSSLSSSSRELQILPQQWFVSLGWARLLWLWSWKRPDSLIPEGCSTFPWDQDNSDCLHFALHGL